jgi:putative redox protein
MQSRGVWESGFVTRLDDGRGHTVTIDEPVEDGGTDRGPAAIELLLLSLTGCISTIFHIIGEKRKLPFEGYTISLKAERRNGAPTIERVHGIVEVRTTASQEEVDTVLRLTVKTCPIGVLFDRAKVPVEVQARIVPP